MLTSRDAVRRTLVGIGLCTAGGIVVLLVWWCRDGDRPVRAPVPRQRGEMSRAHQPWWHTSSLRGIALQNEPEGPLRLEGLVQAGDGQPVEGALVAVDSYPVRSARTAADGSFAIESLLSSTYRIEAWAGGLVATMADWSLSPNSEPVILRLKPGGTLIVSIRDWVQQTPIAGANVTTEAIVPRDVTTDRAGRGILRGLPEGHNVVVACAPGYAKEDRSVSVGIGAPEEVTLELRRGAHVSGVVTDPEGRSVNGARVVPRAPGSGLDAENTAVTDKNGRWGVRVPGTGTYRFLAQHPRWASTLSHPITLEEDMETGG